MARQIFRETLAAIDIPRTMLRNLARAGAVIPCGETPVDLRDYGQFRVVVFGKAAHAMAQGLIGVLGPEFRLSGVVSAPTEPQRTLEGFRYFAAGHPVPTDQSLRAARAILDMHKDGGAQALVHFL